MKTKIFIIIILLFILAISPVYAVDMFLTDNTDNSLTLEENAINEISSNILLENTTTSNPAPTVTYTSNSSIDNTLTISDIISIILIAVCIVLIFLGIAILIRCK